MHESHVACAQPRPPPAVQATSFVHAVFGGRTRSQIQCTGVKYESSVFEPFLDLSLQITGCERPPRHPPPAQQPAAPHTRASGRFEARLRPAGEPGRERAARMQVQDSATGSAYVC